MPISIYFRGKALISGVSRTKSEIMDWNLVRTN